MDASRTLPRLARRSRTRTAVAATTAILIGATMAVVTAGGGPAGADTVNSSVQVSCTTPFGNQSSTVGVVATDTPDPVVGGASMVIAYTVGSASAYPVDLLTSTWPMPAEVSAYDVTYANLGTFVPGSPVYGPGGSSVEVSLTGGSAGGPVPTIEIHVVVEPTAAGQTIDWPVFDSFRTVTSGVPIFGTVDSTCTPRASSIGQTLNSTTVEPPGVCTQTPTDDGWTKTLWGVGPGGASQADGVGTSMYSTDDGTNRFASSLKFAVVGGACDQGGTLPSGVTVIDAAVRLTKTQSCICNGPFQRLHRITQSWSESNLRPTTGPTIDATASVEFATPATFADVSSAQLIADVQGFVDTPAGNEGWSLRQRDDGSTDTGNPATPAGFATRQHGTASARPSLTITYVP